MPGTDIAGSLELKLDVDLGKSKEPVRGMWLNRRALSSITLFVDHQLHLLSGGWEAVATQPGEVHVRYADAKHLRIPFVAGDLVRSLGEDVFVSYAAYRPGGPAIKKTPK